MATMRRLVVVAWRRRTLGAQLVVILQYRFLTFDSMRRSCLPHVSFIYDCLHSLCARRCQRVQF
jgi:hypothetical protein